MAYYPTHAFASHESKTRKILVHQSSLTNVISMFNEKIIRPGQSGSRGKGIYACYNAPLTNRKARCNGTCIYFDGYLGKHEYNINLDKCPQYNSTTNTTFNGHEVVIRSSDRALNFKYLKGDKPYNASFEMRPRMTLLYPTSKYNARRYIRDQEIPIEDRPDIAGRGHYFWVDVPSAQKNALYGSETILVADVYFTNPYENRSCLPNLIHDYPKYESFRGEYRDTYYFMVKYSERIKNIQYIDGVDPTN